MNDFSELEDELKKLRPAQPSPILFERIEEALENCRAGAAPAGQPRTPIKGRRSLVRRWGGLEAAPPWLSLGFGLAAAAVLVLFAAISLERRQDRGEKIAKISPAPEARPVSPTHREGSGGSSSSNRFIPAGATQVVYNTRDEGLQFARGSEQPLRRLRYQTHQTWQWRNPTTGASLRVSYPSEEVVLIPVSGQ
ncbi:MAG TPA: hypothetical protein VJ420_11200 [Candidatus Udaeobacter sp.]|nr:hypothetical protein [Candidatus Udaeobacter sp.]